MDAWWKPYLQRKGVKPSTRRNYDSALELHILPVFGDLHIEEIVPLHVERFSQTKLEGGLSAKTVRNLLLLLQGILAFAVDNDLIARSPIRNRHKPTVEGIPTYAMRDRNVVGALSKGEILACEGREEAEARLEAWKYDP